MITKHDIDIRKAILADLIAWMTNGEPSHAWYESQHRLNTLLQLAIREMDGLAEDWKVKE